MGRKQQLKRVKGAKSSPNVSFNSKINAAITLWKRGETKQEACVGAKVSRATLDRYIKHYDILQSDATVFYADLPNGKPNKMNHIVQIMSKSVAIQKKTLKQMHSVKTYRKVAEGLLKDAQVNQLQALPPFSKRSWKRAYVKSCGTKKMRCSDSFAGRAQAVMDWRNPIGCVCAWNAVLELCGPNGTIKPYNIWSADDVAVTLNPFTQKLQVVNVTPEEHTEMRKRHLTPGAHPGLEKRAPEASNVVCKLFNLVNAEGTRGAITAKLLDSNFRWADDPDRFCAFYCVNRAMELYVACVNKDHPKYDEVEYFAMLFEQVVIPYLLRHRASKHRSKKLSVKIMHSQASASPGSPQDGAQITLEIDGERIVFTMDGHYPGIEAIISRIGALMVQYGIEVVKWAGGCSIVQQPADVSNCHHEVHKAAGSDTFRDDEYGAPTDGMSEFIKFLPELGSTGARLNTLQKFLRHYEWIVDKAWTKHGITEGWRISGMWPMNPGNILSGWSGWKEIPTENAEEIIALCTDINGDAFHEVCRDKFLDDLKAQEIFGHLIEDEEFADYMTDKPPTAAPSNHRVLLLTTKHFDGDVSFMETILAERQAEESRLLAARGEIIDGVQMCVCGLKLPKDVSKHLITGTHERRCRALGIWIEPPHPSPRPSSPSTAPLTPVSLRQNMRESRLDDAVPRAIDFEQEELTD